MRYLLLLIFVFAHAEELVVTLDTAQVLRPVYLAKMQIKSSAFPTSYTDSLAKALSFDLRSGGYTTLLEQKNDRNGKVHEDPFPVRYWSEAGAHYVIAPEITQNKLSIKIFDVKRSSMRELTPVALSGNAETDLPMIHKISDLLHKTLYNAKGIAQKHLFFAMQKEEEGTWISEIWRCDIDGSNLKQLTFENSYSICPLFIPLRERPVNMVDKNEYALLYVCYKHGEPKIYMSSGGERVGKAAIPLRGNQFLPAISRGFDKIAFISDASGRADLFIQLFDPQKGVLHKPVQIFSKQGSVQASPSFSPDGSKIAFVSDQDSTPRIYIVDILAVLRDRKIPELQCITKINRENTSPSWSPDGKKIVYSAKTNGIRQLWLYDVEAQEEMQLTTGQANKENPSFAEDSLHIVYNTTSPSFDIFLLDLNGREPIQITRGAGKKHYPSWEP